MCEQGPCDLGLVVTDTGRGEVISLIAGDKPTNMYITQAQAGAPVVVLMSDIFGEHVASSTSTDFDSLIGINLPNNRAIADLFATNGMMMRHESS